MTSRLTRKKISNPLILNAANTYLQKRLHTQVVAIAENELPVSADPSVPHIFRFHRQKDEQNRLISEIKMRLQNKQNPEDILIVVTSNTAEKMLEAHIKQTLNLEVTVFKKAGIRRKSYIGICTLDFLQNHNLNAPTVLISGLNLLYASEQQFHNDIQKEQNLIEVNTRKLAIAMCRAQQELCLFITADKVPREFISPFFYISTDQLKNKAEVRYLHG